jgi:hypothetical protein
MEKEKAVKWSIMGILSLGPDAALIRILEELPNESYEQFKHRMENYSDEELIEAFNSQVGNRGSGYTMVNFLSAIHDEFKKRGYDFSAVGNKEELSFAKKVKLVGKKVVPVE